MTSIGLFQALLKRFTAVSYMKPVGQQYRLVDDKKIDKDAILFKKVYQLEDPLEWMSPLAVEKGFTENYIETPDREPYANKILDCQAKLSEGKSFLLSEGTGHAGVGSVFDLSNASVAKLMGNKVVLVSLGGIGRSIDELMLNKAVFDQAGVELIGVVINKVREDKYDKIKKVVTQGLARQGVDVLGVIPYVKMLTKPTVAEIHESLKTTLLEGEAGLGNKVNRILIGAMLTHDALDYFEENTLLIVPANREGLVMTALFANKVKTMNFSIAGIIFTGGIKPHEKIIELIQDSSIPFLFSEEDSYVVATKINSLLVKVRASETDKITKIQDLIETYVDVDKICERCGE